MAAKRARGRASRARNRRRPTAVDLFSGCGGLTEGLKRAGFRVLAAVEIDGLAAETYRLNHPGVLVIERDIRDTPAAEVLRRRRLRPGQLDLLAGCPPCQGFSALRTLNGNKQVHDRRNLLTDEFLRFVRVLRPKSVMLENVPGLTGRRRFARFKADLRSLGYRTISAVLDVARYGVPQRRRRLVLLAKRGGAVAFAEPARSRPTVRSAIHGLPRPRHSRDPLQRWTHKRSQRVEKVIRLIPKNGGSREDLPRRMWLTCHKESGGFLDVYGRMSWDAVAPTITSGCLNPSKGRFLHPRQNRVITPREAALLQGFRRSYRFSTRNGMYAVAEMIGNALPPEFVRRHAAMLSERKHMLAPRQTGTRG